VAGARAARASCSAGGARLVPHGIEQRTKFSGKAIDDYSATSGAFRAMLEKVTPDMFPGDPVRAAAAIYQVVASEHPRHWVVLGSDALRRIGVKLDMQRAEIEAGKDMTLSTDYPGAGRAVLIGVDLHALRDGRDERANSDGEEQAERT